MHVIRFHGFVELIITLKKFYSYVFVWKGVSLSLVGDILQNSTFKLMFVWQYVQYIVYQLVNVCVGVFLLSFLLDFLKIESICLIVLIQTIFQY